MSPSLRPRVRRSAGRSTDGRPPKGRWRSAGLSLGLAATMLVAGAGCTTVSDSGGGIDQSRLVNDLASQLAGAGEVTYTADYQLPGGGMASIAQTQDPVRAAYTYPGGKLIVTADATSACTTGSDGARCTVSLPPSPGTDPTTALLSEMVTRGLVLPSLVVELLSAAALDSNAVVKESDTTLAGEHASCLDVSGVSNAKAAAFVVCVISGGLLGRFTGTVEGRPVSINLIKYTRTVGAEAFAPPSGAQVVDRRPGG